MNTTDLGELSEGNTEFSKKRKSDYYKDIPPTEYTVLATDLFDKFGSKSVFGCIGNTANYYYLCDYFGDIKHPKVRAIFKIDANDETRRAFDSEVYRKGGFSPSDIDAILEESWNRGTSGSWDFGDSENRGEYHKDELVDSRQSQEGNNERGNSGADAQNRWTSIKSGYNGSSKPRVIFVSESELKSFNRTDDTDGLLFRSSDSPITPEMDAEYLAAVERGDMETAQRMVIEAAKFAMPNTKVVDKNGNPKVVYHQTNAKVYVNRETGQNWDELNWKEKMEWDERDDWEDYWEEQDFNTFSRVNARTSNEFDGFFFAPKYDEYHEYGERTIAAFVNIQNPASREDYNIDSRYSDAGRAERIRLQEAGFDGVIRMEGEEVDEYIAFEPSQIKSADAVTYDDNGNVIPLSERFNPENPDIRYRKVESQNAAVDNLVGEARLRAIEHAVNAEASKLGVKVTYKTREQMPKGHHNEKGYYNPNTGEIVVCTENATSIADAIQTIFHKAVAHKGLRELMGDRFNEFINRVYESLDAETSPYVLNNQRRQVQQTISRILKPLLTFLIP